MRWLTAATAYRFYGIWFEAKDRIPQITRVVFLDQFPRTHENLANSRRGADSVISLICRRDGQNSVVDYSSIPLLNRVYICQLNLAGYFLSNQMNEIF